MMQGNKKMVAFNQRLNRKQLAIIVLCLASNLSFSLSAIKYLKTQLWGLRYFTIPNLTLQFGHHSIKTYSIVNMHVMLSSALLILMTIQLFSQHARLVHPKVHKVIGYSIAVISLAFFIIGELISVVALKTPFNQVMYIFLPWCVVFGIFGAIYSVHKHHIESHITLVVHAIILLCSAAIYRCVFIGFALFQALTSNNHLKYMNTTPDQLPIDGVAIITYGLLILLCCISITQYKTLRGYIIPMGLLVILVYSISFVPWIFFGVTDINAQITNPDSLLRGFIQAIE